MGRTPTRILRNTEGDSYAIEAHTDPPQLPSELVGDLQLERAEFDDGNGMWSFFGVSH